MPDDTRHPSVEEARASAAIVLKFPSESNVYWGGYTRAGEALHLVVPKALASQKAQRFPDPVAACGRPLVTAYVMPEHFVASSFRCGPCGQRAFDIGRSEP